MGVTSGAPAGRRECLPWPVAARYAETTRRRPGLRASGAVRRGHEGPTSRTRSDSRSGARLPAGPGAEPPRRRLARRVRRRPAWRPMADRRSPAIHRPDRGPGPSAACITGPVRATLLAAAWRSSVTRGRARATPTATAPGGGYYNGGHGYYRPYYGYRPYYPYYPYYSRAGRLAVVRLGLRLELAVLRRRLLRQPRLLGGRLRTLHRPRAATTAAQRLRRPAKPSARTKAPPVG